jgi:ABC-type multidrug transport system ATPase subunit/ABC-type transport system involved in multi-copper enzyme maturation permease subunit
VIAIQGVSKQYGRRRALHDVSFDAAAGTITLLLGANGAGKSTLLRCVLGLIDFDGRIRVDGLDPLTSGIDVRSRIGYMPQNGALHPDLTVAETIAFYADVRGVSRDRGLARLDEAGLAREAGTRVGDLSGGMRQRLGFAIALLTDAAILILDEPSSSLDAASRQWLAARLRQVAAEGRTVLVSTHAGHELFDAGDQCVRLEDGRVQAFEPAREVIAAGSAAEDEVPRERRPGRRGALRPIVMKELRDALRNRWLAGFAGLLGVLGLAAAASAYDSLSGFTLDAFGRTTATLMNLCLLLAPLVAVLMGASAVAGEQERGTLEPLLAQPVSRTQLLLAKYAGLVLALGAAIVAGFVPAGVLIAARSGPSMLAHYLLFPGLALLAAAALAGIGLLISVSSRSAVHAQGTAVVVWFACGLLYDLVLVGSLAVAGLPVHLLSAALVLNPIDAARVLGVLALEPNLYMLGPAGAYLTARLGPAGTAAVLVTAIAAWALVPVLAAALTFSLPLNRRHAHEEDRIGAARRDGRARRGYRMRIGRVGL